MTDSKKTSLASENTLQYATDIVTAYVSNNPLPPSELPAIIQSTHDMLSKLAAGQATVEEEAPKPAVPIKKSITNDYLICLEDGKKLKMLKRYLRSRYNMSPEEYRAKWNLPPDYPMVAPSYAAKRSEFAKEIGLGRGGRGKSKRDTA
ncbi:transcriptional regulator [Rhodothalassium salexigens]|nr:MucR family transcriptional regulator [Rhodothalassium salexigens]MBB4209991.1 putative transcriptional regulator [Rhodothalassium salexigens DSM 2132]MBK1637637.1 transcriptional regulator [Rhodothalassium salexigens DSM 2132]MBK5910689.1 transcriptional regulator [Rhodothalassium salexigens]MBK5920059.1 transcriptional regulator [Rhodothalassium salexigens]